MRLVSGNLPIQHFINNCVANRYESTTNNIYISFDDLKLPWKKIATTTDGITALAAAAIVTTDK